MNRRIRLLLTVMLPCLLGLIVMQGYFAYQNFQREKREFRRTVNDVFRQAVRQEKEARVYRLVELFFENINNPEIIEIRPKPDEERGTIFHFYDPTVDDLRLSIAFNQIDTVANEMTPSLRQQFEEAFKNTVREDFFEGNIMLWTESLGKCITDNYRNTPVDTSFLRSTITSKLDSLGFSTSFTLETDTSFQESGKRSSLRLIRSEPAPLFWNQVMPQQYGRLSIDHPEYAILRRALFSLTGSAAVILLTFLSFYLLFDTILRQKKLSEMKDDFIDNVTHELQTPISALSMAVESLGKFELSTKNERFAEYLRVSEIELQRLSRLVDNILLHSTHLQNGRIEQKTMDLIPLLREASERHRRQAGKPVGIRLPSYEHFPVRSSVFHLNTMLDNLLQNAIRYSPESGVHIDIQVSPNGEGYTLEIADDGWGIEPEDRKHIFEKFYRSSDKNRNYTVKGLGIGLYHVRQCVEQLGGTISVAENTPKGTIFTLTFYDHA